MAATKFQIFRFLQKKRGNTENFRSLRSISPEVYLVPAKHEPFHTVGPYQIETSPLICTANQWTGLNVTGTSVMKKLMVELFYENS